MLGQRPNVHFYSAAKSRGLSSSNGDLSTLEPIPDGSFRDPSSATFSSCVPRSPGHKLSRWISTGVGCSPLFGVSCITPLLAAEEPMARTTAIARPGENRCAYSTDLAARVNPCKVTNEDSAGGFSIFESVIPSHSGPPLHLHHREDEWFYVLAGDFVFEVDGKQTPLPAGGSILAPRRLSHRWANTSEDEGRVIIMLQPGGFEGFFDELFKVIAKSPLVDRAELGGLFAKYDMELLGPAIYATPPTFSPKS